MPDTYTNEDFTRSLVPSGFKKDVIDTVEGAVKMGWRLMITGNGSMTLLSYDDKKRLHFSTRRNSGPMDRMRRTIIKYAEPVRRELSERIMNGEDYSEATMRVLDEIASPVTLARPEDEPKAIKQPKQPPHIVSVKPMIAKATEGKAYESETTLERLWSDGHKDYVCPECNFASDNRLSIRGHVRVHAPEAVKGRSPRPATFKGEVPDAVVYAPQQRRVDALAAFLTDTLGHGAISMDDPEAVKALAKEALTWQHQQSKKGTDLSAEREELDEGDILNRIRVLLDRGQYADQQAQIEALNLRNDELQTALVEQQAKTQRVEETLQTFKELVAEIGDVS